MENLIDIMSQEELNELRKLTTKKQIKYLWRKYFANCEDIASVIIRSPDYVRNLIRELRKIARVKSNRTKVYEKSYGRFIDLVRHL